MKVSKGAIKPDDLRVWCAGCSIRIAPHEEQIAVGGQKYHPHCYSHFCEATSKDAAKRKVSGR
jgi:hypothetical protein